MTIRFPDEFIEPGVYGFSLRVTEKKDPRDLSAGIGTLIAVSKAFTVNVYSHEKALDITLGAGNVNENGTVPFTVDLISRTYSDIDSIWAGITIYDFNNKSVGKVNTNEGSLGALRSGSLEAFFNTTGLTANTYSATAIVHFDGKQKSAEAEFKIGALDITIKNYTSVLEQGFSEFIVEVVNNWGNRVNNVYAKLFVNGTELLQTPSIYLGSWAEGKLKGIVKIDLEPGEYEAILELFYEGESKEKKIMITVIKSSGESKEILFYLMIAGIVVIVILVTLIFFFLVKGRGAKSFDKKENSGAKRMKKKQRREVDEV